MTQVRYRENLANVEAGEVVDRHPSTAEWLVDRGYAEYVAAELPEAPETAAEEPSEPPAHKETPEAPAPVKRRPGRPKKAPEA